MICDGLFQGATIVKNDMGHLVHDSLCVSPLIGLDGADFDHGLILPWERYNLWLMNTATGQELKIQKDNFRYVQIDAVGVSISNVAAPFLPVFLTRLGASNFQVGLLSSMPGVTGLLLAIVVGRFLQTQRNVVP